MVEAPEADDRNPKARTVEANKTPTTLIEPRDLDNAPDLVPQGFVELSTKNIYHMPMKHKSTSSEENDLKKAKHGIGKIPYLPKDAGADEDGARPQKSIGDTLSVVARIESIAVICVQRKRNHFLLSDQPRCAGWRAR